MSIVETKRKRRLPDTISTIGNRKWAIENGCGEKPYMLDLVFRVEG